MAFPSDTMLQLRISLQAGWRCVPYAEFRDRKGIFGKVRPGLGIWALSQVLTRSLFHKNPVKFKVIYILGTANNHNLFD